jgi:hypothetical protein
MKRLANFMCGKVCNLSCDIKGTQYYPKFFFPFAFLPAKLKSKKTWKIEEVERGRERRLRC